MTIHLSEQSQKQHEILNNLFFLLGEIKKTVGRKWSSRCIFSSDTFNGSRPTSVVCSARSGYVDEFSPS